MNRVVGVRQLDRVLQDADDLCVVSYCSATIGRRRCQAASARRRITPVENS